MNYRSLLPTVLWLLAGIAAFSIIQCKTSNHISVKDNSNKTVLTNDTFPVCEITNRGDSGHLILDARRPVSNITTIHVFNPILIDSPIPSMLYYSEKGGDGRVSDVRLVSTNFRTANYVKDTFFLGKEILFARNEMLLFGQRNNLIFQKRKGIKKVIPIPPSVRFQSIIFDRDGGNLFWCANWYVYRYGMVSGKLDSVLFNTENSQVGDVATDNLVLLNGCDNDTLACLNFMDKDLRIVKKVYIPVPNSFYLPITCIKFNPQNDKEIYYSFSGKGIYKLNTITGLKSLVIASCKEKRYERFIISADGKSLIAECLINSELLGYHRRLIFIDLYTLQSKLLVSDI